MVLPDSRTLIQLLKWYMKNEISQETLQEFLLSTARVVKALTYGLRSQPYWPRENEWLTNARETIVFSYGKDGYNRMGIDKLLSCCRGFYTEEVNIDKLSLAGQFVRLFDTIFKIKYENNVDAVKSDLLHKLQSLEISVEVLDAIDTFTNPHEISVYLAKCGANKGKVFPQYTPSITSNTDTDITICSPLELEKRGISLTQLAKKLMDNDMSLYGSALGRHAGSVQTWAAHMHDCPDNWSFLCKYGTEIVGNWSCVFINEEQEKTVRAGLLIEGELSVGDLPNPRSDSENEVAIYLLNMSINPGYESEANQLALWKSFGSRLQQLAVQGIFYRAVYINLLLNERISEFEKMGFRWVVSNKEGGETFCLDLMSSDFFEKFSWIFPDSDLANAYKKHWKKDISYRQLTSDDQLTNRQLAQIASLIHDTDRYIYEKAMMTRRQAKRLLPLIMESGEDTMFRLDNIYCAFAGENIIGIILFHTGPLHWSSAPLQTLADFKGESLSPHLTDVETNYFSEYAKTAPNTTAILNVCVHRNWRMRDDIRIGSEMMKNFLTEHPEHLELYVLEETPAAQRLYQKMGFRITSKCEGYSAGQCEHLPCYFMERAEQTT